MNAVMTKWHLHVLVPGFHNSAVSLERHSMASVRMRSALAARAAERLGWLVTFGERFDGSPDLLYVGKIGGHQAETRGPAWLRYIQKVRERGCRIIVDYTDHYCGFDGVMTKFYRNLIPFIDHLITPSATMTKMVKEVWSGVPVQIEDPCEVQSRPVRLPGAPPWRALWFGSCTNIRYLINFLEDARNILQLRRLNIVTDAPGCATLVNWLRSLDKPFPLSEIELFNWSLTNLIKASESSDIVVIPSDTNDPRKVGVSENRLVTSLQLGLTTVASPLPSYLRLIDSFVILDETWSVKVTEAEGLCFERIATQRMLSEEFCKERLTNLWMTTLAGCRMSKYKGFDEKQIEVFECSI